MTNKTNPLTLSSQILNSCNNDCDTYPTADTNDNDSGPYCSISDEDLDRALDEFLSRDPEDEDYNFNDEASSPDDDPSESGEISIQVPELSTRPSPIDNLIGLKSVKEKLSVYEKVVLFNKMRKDYDLSAPSLPLHALFLGSPGTGKTTVAKMMGYMLAKAGVLSRGHVVVRERATLLGPNYSMEESNTLKAIDEAQGGILLIDEAYQLYQPADPRDPGRFVIETLMTALADGSRRDWMLILAGYHDETLRMFEMNTGLKSRIPESNIYVFDDYSESELLEIAERYLERHQYSLSAEARKALSRRLRADYLRRDKSFGNARHVINLIQTDILPAMAVRVISDFRPGVTSLSEIQADDIPAPVKTLSHSRQRIGYCA